MQPEWRSVGEALRSTFEHIAVISLATSADRRAHMRRLLEGRLGLRAGADFTFVDAAPCADYSRLQPVAPPRSRGTDVEPVPRAGTAWWLHPESCPAGATAPSALPPHCLSPEMEPCRRLLSAQRAKRECGEVCYSLSVVRALRHHLQTNRSRVLLLEDDVCATPHLLHARRALSTLRGMRWHVAKLGHCLMERKGVAPLPAALGRTNASRTLAEPRCVGAATDGGATGGTSTRVASLGQAAPPGNHVQSTPGRSFCAHALGVDREGARRLLRLAFPVRSVFDDVLYTLAGGLGADVQASALAAAGLRSAEALGAVHLKYSLFAQLSRAAPGGGAALGSLVRGH